MDSLHWRTEKRKVAEIMPWEGNPRKISDEQAEQLKRSLEKFNLVEIPAIDMDNRLIAGHQRVKILLALGRGNEEIDVRVPNRKLTTEEFEEYNVRSNLTTGEFDWEMLANFDESFLSDVGFSSQELDRIFEVEEEPETFDLQKELEKLDINTIEIKKGDIWALGESRMMCGDSTIEAEFKKLMGGEKADMCMTDPPYILDYLKGKKKHGEAATGFGYKRDRRYLETESLPDNFTELWMNSVAEAAKPNFAIIVYENWKNIRTIWDEMEKHWKVKNMIVWHLENRHQGFSSKYRFFNKHDIAMVGGSGDVEYNHDPEEAPLQEEYETALYAISGKPQWESYEKGKKNCPTDFIEFRSSDEKHSGQGVIFGTKPTEILIPYIKMLTRRGDLVIEPFGGSGSTLIASTKLKRRCFLMEKSPVYAEVIRKRWENLTGLKATRVPYGE